MLGLTVGALLSRVLILVVAFTVHEFAHAWSANELGDDTPRLNGRLTLNPLAHLDVVGSMLLLLTGFGWAKPVPINPYALQRRMRAGVMLVAGAGPFSNLILAILAAIALRLGISQPLVSQFLLQFIFINLVLLFFNMIPLFPLDGEKVLAYLLPPPGQDAMARIRPYGPMILMGMIVVGSLGAIDIIGALVTGPAMFMLSQLV
ncbi:MAG: site-2 protease family protein [Anaerolineales bacterium]|nr:site-2 protease family protein [Anaerolineales bacterium]